MTLSRRGLLGAGVGLLAGLVSGARAAGPPAVEIRMVSRNRGGHVGFEPVGLLVPPGTLVRWLVEADVHTTTAYHPDNGRPLRIPDGAEPWDSGYLVEPGAAFERRLTVEGVYDYYCAPHERAGMVGRIVVGRPGGPGSRPFGSRAAAPDGADLQPVPPTARAAFPSIEAILEHGRIDRL